MNNGHLKKVEKIKQLLAELQDEMDSLNIPDEILEKEITEFGNSAHIILPKDYAKKSAIIIVKK
jgi:putative transposon-encoded protein